MAEERQVLVDWSEMTDDCLMDRLAEKLVGSKIDSVQLTDVGGVRKMTRIQLDNGVSLFLESFYLGEE